MMAVEGGDPEEVRAAARKVRGALDPHTGSEERALFARMRQDEEFTEPSTPCAPSTTTSTPS